MNEQTPGGAERPMQPVVIRLNDRQCSYRCPYYMDGPVLSLCKKHGRKLKYEGGKGPPLLDYACRLTDNAG